MMNAGERDRLTGLWDGATLQERIEEHLERERKPAAVAVIDIDNFKTVNDRLGQTVGDRVLCEVARILQDAASTADPGNVTARLRGDEFAIFFPEQDTDEAFAVLEEARRKVQDAGLPGDGSSGLPRVTISAGIASSPRDATGITDLLRKADDGLWRAKKGNRNRIGLPSDDRMVLKSTYYSTGQLERLGALAAQRHTTEASLLREALDDLLRKYADKG